MRLTQMKKKYSIDRTDLAHKSLYKKAQITKEGVLPNKRDREALAELIKKIKAM